MLQGILLPPLAWGRALRRGLDLEVPRRLLERPYRTAAEQEQAPTAPGLQDREDLPCPGLEAAVISLAELLRPGLDDGPHLLEGGRQGQRPRGHLAPALPQGEDQHQAQGQVGTEESAQRSHAKSIAGALDRALGVDGAVPPPPALDPLPGRLAADPPRSVNSGSRNPARFPILHP